MNDLVSIIVPIYNVKDYLDRCILSLKNQTYSDIEILLIDDGSTDDSGYICDKYASKDDRIHVFHKENGGVSSARNCGLESANGSFICFVDADDWVESDYVEKLLNCAIENNSDIVCCGYYTAQDTKQKEISKQYEFREYDTEEALRKLYQYEMTDYPWDKLYRKELWDDIRYPLNTLCEDMGTTFKVFAKSKRVCMLDAVLYYYWQRDNSSVHTITVRSTEDTFLMYKSRCEFFVDFFKDKNISSTKELVKLAYFVCVLDKEKTRAEVRQQAFEVLETYKVMPDIGLKDKAKLIYMRMSYRLLGKTV